MNKVVLIQVHDGMMAKFFDRSDKLVGYKIYAPSDATGSYMLYRDSSFWLKFGKTPGDIIPVD
jgi:hypothetical protein